MISYEYTRSRELSSDLAAKSCINKSRIKFNFQPLICLYSFFLTLSEENQNHFNLPTFPGGPYYTMYLNIQLYLQAQTMLVRNSVPFLYAVSLSST